MKKRRYQRFCLQLTVFAFLLASCSGAGSQNTAVPTKVPATLTPFPTFAFVEPTKAAVFGPDDEDDDAATGGEDESTATFLLDPKKVDRGLARYEALECADCHGVGGAGTDKADGLLGFALSEDDFITFMRSGGVLGTDHQYSTDRLSNSGSRNLYQYLVSLAQGN